MSKETVRTLRGRVTSDKMDKTVTVMVERKVPHPVYGKYIRRSSKIQAHDEENRARVGDTVRISSCRPISKQKSWTVVDIVDATATE